MIDKDENKLIFDYSEPGKSSPKLPQPELAFDASSLGALLRKNPPKLPDVSEIEVMRHYTGLSKMNYGVETGFYPLGSCTMKYNPKLNDDMAALDGFSAVHPLADEADSQGILELLFELEKSLCNIFGFKAFTLQPAAGAQGEYTGLLMMQAYHASKGHKNKNVILVPDSSHGTNPASVTCVDWTTVTVKSYENGKVNLEDLGSKLNDNVAGMMLTNPNTLGIFESDILHISQKIHELDGLMYWDGANANAVMGYMKPGLNGFDVAHLNLHKTFSTPHGGGGPGAGPVGVNEKLIPFLPSPHVIKEGNQYVWRTQNPQSVGRLHSFYGNVGILVRAYTYICSLGALGLKEVSENSVLLANYMKTRLAPYYSIVTQGVCKHEFVISLKNEKKDHGVKALDVAKRLMDYGFHPPTIYFPLIAPEALMIETPETEPFETIESFIEALIAIKHDIVNNPERLTSAPHTAPITRLDEVKAAKEPKLTYYY